MRVLIYSFSILLFILISGCATPPPLPNFTNEDFLSSTSTINICKTPPNYIASQMVPTIKISLGPKYRIEKNIPYRFPVNVGDDYIVGLFDKSHTQLHMENWFTGKIISKEKTYILIKPKPLHIISAILKTGLSPNSIITQTGGHVLQDLENKKIKSQLKTQFNRVEVWDYGTARYVSEEEFKALCPE
mgnify:CR=1 FL=1